MIEALRAGSLQGVTDRLGNVLETVTAREYPVIEEIKKLLRLQGAENALMSGSGPTVFGIFTGRGKAEHAAGILGGSGLAGEIYVTTFQRGTDRQDA